MDKTAVNQILEELNEVMLNTIEETIKIADKYEFDRDETIKIMAEKFGLLAEVGTFVSYKIKENSADTPQNSAGGWIPCSERLPDKDVYVLCQGNHSMFIACVDSLDNKWRDDHYHTRTTIKAWQPLPEPYKEV